MSDNEMLYCLIAFIIGWLASRHMGNGFSVGAAKDICEYSSQGVTILLEDKLGLQMSVQGTEQIKEARNYAKNTLCPNLNNLAHYSKYFPESIPHTPEEICQTLSIGFCKYNDK